MGYSKDLLKENEFYKMNDMFDMLFPVCRSITGEGLRKSLEIIKEQIPLKVEGVPTGTKVFDWEIPKEWVIREAWLKDPEGNIVVDFNKNNLTVVNYSAPVNRKIDSQELKNHLFTLPRLYDAIPYVTSYYKRRWGFCLSHRQYEELKEGEYHAYIDSDFINGELNYGHRSLKGKEDNEILLASYLCHPSMANNELSGPLVLAFLYKRLCKWTDMRFSYRFVLHPETIGSIAYLWRYGKELKNKVYSGLVLTCLGGSVDLSYKASRKGDAAIDKVISNFTNGSTIRQIRPFTPINGSDERQYCSPGFNLPVGQMARTVYGEYKGYHNSLDTKEFMTIEALQKSVDELENILIALEYDGKYYNQKPYGEVKLDKYNLYPDMNSPTTKYKSNNELIDGRKKLDCILMILNYSDGEHFLSDIANKLGYNISTLIYIIDELKEKGLIIGPY